MTALIVAAFVLSLIATGVAVGTFAVVWWAMFGGGSE